MYFKILFLKFYKKINVLHNLVSKFTLKGFYIANFALFIILNTNKNLWRLEIKVKNKVGTILHQALPS